MRHTMEMFPIQSFENCNERWFSDMVGWSVEPTQAGIMKDDIGHKRRSFMLWETCWNQGLPLRLMTNKSRSSWIEREKRGVNSWPKVSCPCLRCGQFNGIWNWSLGALCIKGGRGWLQWGVVKARLLVGLSVGVNRSHSMTSVHFSWPPSRGYMAHLWSSPDPSFGH